MKNERSRIWTDYFQSKLFFRIIVYWFIFLVCMWNFLFLWQFVAEGGDPWEQYSRFYHNFYPMILCFVMIVPFFAWDAVRFSHRLVGPLVRFQRTFRAIATGEPVEPVRLRDDDFLKEMQYDLNSMLSALERRGAVTVSGPIPNPEAEQPQTPGLKAISEKA